MEIPWLVCNKCYIFLNNPQSDYFIGNCGNLFCKDCAEKISDTCPVCQAKPLKLTPHSQMPAKMKTIFQYSQEPQLERLMKASKFQDLQLIAVANHRQQLFKCYQKGFNLYNDAINHAKKTNKLLHQAKTAYAELKEKEKLITKTEKSKPFNFFETTPETITADSKQIINSLQHLQVSSAKGNPETYMRLNRNQENQMSMRDVSRIIKQEASIARNQDNQRPVQVLPVSPAGQVDSDRSSHIFESRRTRQHRDSFRDEGYSTPTPGRLFCKRTPAPVTRQGGLPQRFDGHAVGRQPHHLIQSKRVHINSSDSEASVIASRKQQRTPDGLFRIPLTPKSARSAEKKYTGRLFS